MGGDLTPPATGGWRTVAASVAGTAHEQAGLPCADAWLVREVRLASGGSLLLAAVSDGAGSSVQAPEGARLACATAAALAEDWAGRSTGLGAFAPDTAREWLEQVRGRLAGVAAAEGEDLREYSATLLVALVDEAIAVFLQVGDGAIVWRTGSSPFTPALWPQRGEYANTTWFVTDEAVGDVVQMARFPGVDEVALLTDGLQGLALRFASREAHGPFFDPLFQALRGPEPPGEDALAAFLGSARVNARTDDDKTLVLATRLRGGE